MAPSCLWSSVDIYLFLNAPRESSNSLESKIGASCVNHRRAEWPVGNRCLRATTEQPSLLTLFDTFVLNEKNHFQAASAWQSHSSLTGQERFVTDLFNYEPDETNPIPRTVWQSDIFYVIFSSASRSAILLSQIVFIVLSTLFPYLLIVNLELSGSG